MAIPNMNNRNRGGYVNNRNIRQYNLHNHNTPHKFEITQQVSSINQDTPNEIPTNSPPLPKPPQNNTQNNNTYNNRLLGGSIGGILDMLKSKNISLDKDRIIILILMYLLYKEDKEKINLKLLLALGYILL